MTEEWLGELLGRSVRLAPADLRLGTVAGVYLAEGLDRILGLDVSSRDGRARFLPWVACGLDEDGVHVRSAFLLVETGELDPYLRRGARLLRTRADLGTLGAVGDDRVRPREPTEHVSARLAAGTSLA